MATPVSSTPNVACTCMAGCPACVPGLAPQAGRAPSTHPRNVALKGMRAAVPARVLLPGSVLASTGPGVARRAGSKAAACVAYYQVGATVATMLAAMPAGMQAYGKACMVWDLQHGHATFTGLGQ